MSQDGRDARACIYEYVSRREFFVSEERETKQTGGRGETNDEVDRSGRRHADAHTQLN